MSTPNAKAINTALGNAATNGTKAINAVMGNTSASAKALNTVLGNASGRATNTVLRNASKANSPMNAVANVAANVSKNMQESATNSLNSITNSIKSLNTSIAEPIRDSISAVPESAVSLAHSLPLIIGIGALVIALTLVIYYRDLIGEKAVNAYSSVKSWFNEVTGANQPAPPPAENPLEYPIQSQDVPEPKTDVINQILPGQKQVFNVSANKYSYADAEPLCRAMGAELATYDQVKQAWDNGADWCNYGWVKGQAAVYPTQQTTFDDLQSGGSDDERLACGQPGVNGGYFDNPELRFGVNCYGEKPSQTSNDLRVTNENAHPPLTADALGQKKKELAYKANINQIGLLPFKTNTWSS